MRLLTGGLLLLVLGLSGCSWLQSEKLWLEPEARILSARLQALSLESATLGIEIEVHNPNAFSIQTGALDYQLLLLNQPLLSGQQLQGTRLPAGGVARIELPVTLVFADMARLLPQLADRNSLDYQLQAGIRFELPWIGERRVGLSLADSFPVPQLPAIRLASIRQQSLSLSGVTLLVNLAVDNPNSFALQLADLDYELALNRQTVAVGAARARQSIAAEDSASLQLPVELSFREMGQALYDVVRQGGQLDYRLTVNAEVGTGLPLLEALPLSETRSGQISLQR